MSRINPFHPLNDLLAEDVPATPYSEPDETPLDEGSQDLAGIDRTVKDLQRSVEAANKQLRDRIEKAFNDFLAVDFPSAQVHLHEKHWNFIDERLWWIQVVIINDDAEELEAYKPKLEAAVKAKTNAEKISVTLKRGADRIIVNLGYPIAHMFPS